ncbi:hypothetical protein [Pseudosulfitobacter pseudonitzschiae]|uniref:hypothetical protein n=1 Tax=Pseudosulfitobacter pseudonitzschiae TaxID=1402135 RepID=UPI001AF8D56A|nr:hypothetical protein [Pseudosulfitobacter pseudonitzschiae]MBM1817160.1 hypothetical protein [Pseudosulfitobacter pseudonitzschiae]MBM1834163.1 hypothetical protein [Pseudosulfitobacter pseudonitzschiae]MBM1839028.1 hypothetical protein [Pseudosulfitobacter pseudonitzschiae]MBM1843878.1 hypothetical protein [Pseudosulfitobacter pseudonitzschiae]MBM1853585.1 hypothetical protein [Pseudosulfitobacter pseudonitzschiae]
MTKKERAKLRREMSKLIAAYLQDGERVTTAQICEITIDRFPDLIAEAREQLLKTALTNMARTLLKEASKAERDEMEVNLFGNIMSSVTIPRCIALPQPDSREMVWTSVLKASLAEIDIYIKYLNSGAIADMAKASKLKTFRDLVADMSLDDDLDMPIEALLQGLREQESRA